MDTVFTILALLMLVSLVLALVSLVTPKAAFFLTHKTRLRAFFAYIGLSLVFLFAAAVTAPKTEQPAAIQPAEPAASAGSAPAPAPAEQKAPEKSEPAPAVQAAQPMPYRLLQITDTSFPQRKRARVRIALADPDAQATADTLAATCMAAAKHFASSRHFQALSVFIDDGSSQPTRLASCSHSPDSRGWSGEESWTWKDVQAAARGLTRTERRVKELWMAWRAKYQKDGATDEEALSAAIAKELGIKADDVAAAFFVHLDPLDGRLPKNVPPQGPAE